MSLKIRNENPFIQLYVKDYIAGSSRSTVVKRGRDKNKAEREVQKNSFCRLITSSAWLFDDHICPD